MTVDVSRASGYAVLQNHDIALSKAEGYVVLLPKKQDVSWAAVYAVLVEGPPDPFDLEIRLSKAAAFAVLVPGINGPVSYASSAAADILMQTNDRLRVTHRTAEVAQTTESAARVTNHKADVLINAAAGARIGALVFDVLRSTAEVTVQGLITAQVVDVAYDHFGNARTASVYAEVLIASDLDGEGFGSVALMN